MLSLFSASPSLTVGVAPVTAPRAAASMAASSLPFTKYHGLGNDFVLLDCRDMAEPPLTPTQAASMCDRNFGVGADGVIFVLPPDTEDARVRMRIYNSDGSEPEMCGNGIRCMAKYFSAELESLAAGQSDQYTISTLAGPIIPEILANGEIKVDMGEPILEGKLVPTTLPSDDDGRVVEAPMSVGGKDWKVTCVSMGNPHAVVFVDDLDALDFDTVGPLFEVDAAASLPETLALALTLARARARTLTLALASGLTLALTLTLTLTSTPALSLTLHPTSTPAPTLTRSMRPSPPRPTRSSCRCSRPPTSR